MLALQCGGSDGYSGITANPALGAAADILVRNGGTAILSETPEIYGAEHLLTRRAATPEIGHKLVDLIHWWEDYCARNGGEMNNNPSPGNKAGGLTTILEKSLGAAAKGGTTPLNGVYRLRRAGHRQGLRLHGYARLRSRVGDRAGRGRRQRALLHDRARLRLWLQADALDQARHQQRNVPQRMIEDMDINCGDVLDGVSIEEKGQEIFEQDSRGRFGRAHQVRARWAMATRNSRPGRSGRRCDDCALELCCAPERRMKTALLFDLDGTLVDSDAEHLVAFQRVFAPHGIELDRAEYAANIMGASNAMIASRYLAHLSPAEQAATLDAKEAAYRDALGALEPILGALALLDFADRRGLKRAVVTNAPRANAEKVLGGVRDRAALADRGDRRRACALQARPFALSDGASSAPARWRPIRLPSKNSLSGVRAAAAAGLAVVGMTTTLEFENADRRRRDIRGQQFHRSTDLRAD